MDLLKSVVSERGRWTQAVYAEARQSAGWWPSLSEILDHSILGEPIETDDPDQVNRIRMARLGGSPLIPTEHLGEAETCYLIHNDAKYAGSTWITDDHDAFDFADQLGIVTWDTRFTLENLITMGDITSKAAFDLMQQMYELGREPRRMPTSYRDLE